MATLARLDVILGLNTRGFSRSIDRMQFKLRKIGQNLQRTGSALTRSLTLPLALAGVAAIKMSVDFESSMSKIVGLVGHSREQVAAWSKQLLDLGPKVAKGPKELADAMFFITSAGLKGTAAMEALTASAQASAAGLGETAVVADAVTSAMNAYGAANLDAAQATAILVATVKEGKAGAEELAPVLGSLLPIASELGIEFHEVGAAIAAMTRVGAAAPEAATSLKSLMVGIIKPASQSREQIEAMGLSIDSLRKTIKQKGILAALGILAEKMEGNLDALGKVFPNQRALTAVLNATGSAAEATAGIYARLAKVTKETLAEAFAAAAETAEFKLLAALSSLQVTLIRLADEILPRILPLIQNFATFIEDAGIAFSKLDENTQGMILGLVAFAGIIGPLLTGLGGIALLLGGLSTTMVGWTLAVVAGAAIIVKNWQAVKDAVKRFIDFASPALEYFKLILADLWGDVLDTAKRIWPDVQRIFQNVVDLMVGIWVDHGETLKTIWQAALLIIKGGLTVLLGGLEVISAFLAGDFSKAWGALKNTAKKALDFLATAGGILWLTLAAGMKEFEAEALAALGRMIARAAALAEVFLAMPFINPLARAAGRKALDALAVGMGGIGTQAEAAKARALELRDAAALLAGPLTKAKTELVEMQGAWVSANEFAKNTATNVVTVFTGAGAEVSRQLEGGFGEGIEKGVERGKVAVTNMRNEIEATPIKITFDVEDLDRKLDERAGRANTGGSLGV